MRQKPADCHVSELRVRFSRSCASEKSRATLCPWRWFYKAIYIRVSILLVSPLKASSLSGWLASPRPLTFSAPGRRSAQSRLQMGMKHAGRVKQTHADAGMFWLFLQSNEWQGFKTLHSRVRTNIKIRNEWMRNGFMFWEMINWLKLGLALFTGTVSWWMNDCGAMIWQRTQKILTLRGIKRIYLHF